MKKRLARITAFFKDRGVKPKELLLVVLTIAVVLAVGIILGKTSTGGGQKFPVYISEVLSSNTYYPNAEGRCSDYIEIHNGADYAVDLTGFQMGDIAGKSRYAFPAGTILQSGEYLVIYCDSAVKDAAYAPFDISRAGGESFYLIAKNNAIVDSVVTVSMDADQSMVRQADRSWSVSAYVTPGTSNETVETGYTDIYNPDVSAVRITEFASTDTGYLPQYQMLCDWVELYNTSAEPVDISGYTLSDNVGNDKYTFPQGTVIEGNTYLVVNCTDQVTDPAVAPFGLSRRNEETVVLKHTSGMIVEIVRSMPMETGAMALCEDGTWAITQEISAGFENTLAGYERFLQETGTMAGGIRISEVMSADQLVLADSFGEFPDWVELQNTTDRSINLAGWCLSDDPADPQKWMIPEMVLQPGAYALVFCSGRDVTQNGEVHAAFSLSASGESLTLRSYAGTVVDTVNFPGAEAHTAFVFDEENQIIPTELPTPGYPNDEAGYEDFCAARVPAGPLAIWEVMTSNDSFLPQNLGECYDWVELRNVSDSVLDLSDFSISDDLDVPGMHTFSGRTLQPGDSATVILTSEAGMVKDGFEQVPFSLDAQEDQLFLFDGEGNLLDYVYLRDIPLGCSYGRSDEDGGFRYMEPSPQNPNFAGYRLISSAVVSSYVPGVYSQEDSFRVTLEANGTIYYTTDGSEPDSTSMQYTDTLQFDDTTVLRAASIEEGKRISDIYTATFIVGDTHELPVVSLVTDPDGLWGFNGVYRNGELSVREIQLPAHVSYSGKDGSFAINCATNLHGATTVRAFDKKSFAVRFQDGYDGPLHYDVFEDGEVTTFRSLILRTSHESSVSTQMHDAMIGQIASEGSDHVLSQKHKYVALYLNGEYWGLYAIRERHSEDHYASYMNEPAEGVQIVRYMIDESNSLKELYDFCENNSLAYDENYAYAKTVLDMESFADWIIYEAYMANLDINGNVRYYQSPVDGLWRMGLADLDLGIVGSSAAFDEVAGTFHHGRVVRSLMANEEFQHLLATRLAELLEGPLSDENVLALIDEMAATIRPETAWEEARWGTTVESWEGMVDYMIRFCDGRAQEMIDSLCLQLGFSKQERETYFGHLE